jgi:hypothetical protein
MVEVAQELVEAVIGRQHLVAVAEVVLAELAGHVAMLLEQPGDSRVLFLHAFRRSGESDLGQTGAHGRLAGDECGAAGCAALLAVPVRKHSAFGCDAVDIRRLVAHHPHVVGRDIELADVIPPDDEDVGFVLRHSGARQGHRHHSKDGDSDYIRSHFILLSILLFDSSKKVLPQIDADPRR